MTHPIRTSLYATAAISAALAFGSTQAAAQDAAAPTIQLPPVAAPAAPAPAIVLPPASAPVAEASAPKAAPRAERASPNRVAQAPAPAPRAAPAPVPAAAPVAATAPVAPVAAEIAPPAPVAAQPQLPSEAPVAQAPQADSVRSSVDIPDELIGVVGLGVVVLGGFGVAAMMRRRREREALEETVYEPEQRFVAEEPITSMPEELAVSPAQSVAAPVARVQPSALQDGPVQGGPVQDGPVPTGEERLRLIDEMVAQAPDADNPFTSVKGRRKRARLILQSRAHEFGEQGAQPFDWRTYRSPTTIGAASPPLVDAY